MTESVIRSRLILMVAMCGKCQEIEARIQRYYWLATKAIDHVTVESIKALIIELRQRKAVIEHPSATNG